jgi:PAS domain-containing protein
MSFSGTPTVVWRRTGEICLVAPEFCTLTDWKEEELLGRRKYIYELFDDRSVVEYWDNFAQHAFENTTKSVNSRCVLLGPSGTTIPCTFCFSVRRDLFDLPSHVIGEFVGSVGRLPLLLIVHSGQWLPLL